MTAAIGNMRRRSQRGNAIAAALFIAGYFALPPGRPRRIYAWTAVFSVTSVVTTDLDGWDRAPYAERCYNTSFDLGAWKAFIGVPTIWTWLFAPAAIYCWVQLIRIIWAIRTGRCFQPIVVDEEPRSIDGTPSAAAQPVTKTYVDAQASKPVATPPAPAQEPPGTSKLILPSHTQRRVRRISTILSFMPINDRGAIDPRTARPRESD